MTEFTEEKLAPEIESPPKVRAALLYCGMGGLMPILQEVGIDVVYAHDGNRMNRTQFKKRFGLAPDNRGYAVYFTDVPEYDIVIANMPKIRHEHAMGFINQFLRVRKPEAFVLTGGNGDSGRLIQAAREQTRSLEYCVATAGEAVQGIYEPNIVVGLRHIDPIWLNELADPMYGTYLPVVRRLLRRLVETPQGDR